MARSKAPRSFDHAGGLDAVRDHSARCCRPRLVAIACTAAVLPTESRSVMRLRRAMATARPGKPPPVPTSIALRSPQAFSSRESWEAVKHPVDPVVIALHQARDSPVHSSGAILESHELLLLPVEGVQPSLSQNAAPGAESGMVLQRVPRQRPVRVPQSSSVTTSDWGVPAG